MIKRILMMFCGAIILMMPLQISSHHYVLVPDKFIYKQGETMQVHLMVGEVFEYEFEREMQTGMTPRFKLITREKVTDLLPGVRDSMIPVASPVADFNGLGMIVMQRNPSLIEEKPGNFQKYLMEDHVNGISFDSPQWTGPVVHEKYSRYLKSLVLAGKASNEMFFTQGVGLKLELIIHENPYHLRDGEDISVSVLLDGKPLPKAEVGVSQQVGSNLPKTNFVLTDKEGLISLHPIQDAVYVLHCVYIRKLDTDKEADFESYWASYSFKVLPDKE